MGKISGNSFSAGLFVVENINTGMLVLLNDNLY
jgi:hypothetical protein